MSPGSYFDLREHTYSVGDFLRSQKYSAKGYRVQEADDVRRSQSATEAVGKE